MPIRKEESSATGKSAPTGNKKTSWFRRNKTKQTPLTDTQQQDDNKREKQLQAYVAWINSHLRKKPGCKLIQDLRTDIADGISLIHLVEVISGEVLQHIDRAPMSQAAKKDNVEKVLQYMIGRKIRMHETTSRDIMEGSLKSIMRLILALAAHFKPTTVGKPAPLDAVSLQSGFTTSIIYSNPAAKTPPTRKHLSTGSFDPAGYSPPNPFSSYAINGPGHGDIVNLSDVNSDFPPFRRPSVYRQLEPGGGGVKITRAKERFCLIDLDSSVASSMCIPPTNRSPHNGKRLSDLFMWPSPEIQRAMIPSPQSRKKATVRKRRSSAQHSPEKIRTRHSHIVKPGQTSPGQQQQSHSTNVSPFTIAFGIEEPSETSTSNLDVSCTVVDDKADDSNEPDGAMMSRKVQAVDPKGAESEDNDDIESQDSDAEIMPVLLEQRDATEKELTEMKSFLYGLQHLLLSSDAPENAVIPTHEFELKDELTLSLAEGDQLKHKLRALQIQLEESEKNEESLKGQNSILLKKLDDSEETIRKMQAQLREPSAAEKGADRGKSGKLEERNDTLEELRSQLIARDNMIDQLQKQLDEATRRIVDLETVQESLQMQLDKKTSQVRELQSSLNVSQTQRIPNHNGSSSPEGFHANPSRSDSWTSDSCGMPAEILSDIDNIQREVAGLKVSLSRSCPQQCKPVELLEHSIALLFDKIDCGHSQGRRRKSLRNNDVFRSMRKSKSHHDGSLSVSSVSTKVAYYTSRNQTPFLTSIPKRLGEITLRDFRDVFDRPGSYRFHFKAMDPEFGAVKLELSHEDDIIPGWEGRVVVWVEEDTYV